MSSIAIFIVLIIMAGWIFLVIDCERYAQETAFLIEKSLARED